MVPTIFQSPGKKDKNSLNGKCLNWIILLYRNEIVKFCPNLPAVTVFYSIYLKVK
jgi:hypothetical protein